MSSELFPVPADWAEKAWCDNDKYVEMYERSIQDPEGFWAEEGKRITWIRDYSKVKVIEGAKMKTKQVYNTMKKFASKEYKTKFDKNVKATLKLLLEYDKINNAVKVLKEKREREGADISKGEAKKIEKELADLEERQKKAEEKEKELLTFELKGAKKKAA